MAQVNKVFKDGTKSLIEFFEYSDSDVLNTKKITGTDEQTLQETEYLNGKLNGFRKYYYNK